MGKVLLSEAVLFGLLVFSGILGNILVIYVVIICTMESPAHHMPPSDLILLNLSLANLLTSLFRTVPIFISDLGLEIYLETAATLRTLAKHIHTVTTGVESGAAHVHQERKAGHVILTLVALFVSSWVMQVAAVTYYNFDGGVHTEGLLTVSQFSASVFVGFSPLVVAFGHGKLRKRIMAMVQELCVHVGCISTNKDDNNKKQGALESSTPPVEEVSSADRAGLREEKAVSIRWVRLKTRCSTDRTQPNKRIASNTSALTQPGPRVYHSEIAANMEKSSGRTAHYKLTSTVMLWLQTTKTGSGTMNLGGSLTRQVTIEQPGNTESKFSEIGKWARAGGRAGTWTRLIDGAKVWNEFKVKQEKQREICDMRWDLLFCVFVCLKLPMGRVHGFVVNLRADAKPGSIIARAGHRGSACALYQVIAPNFTRGFLKTDHSEGTLSVSRSLPRCRALPTNPFPVYTVADCASDVSDFRHLLISQYHVRVHGEDCRRKSQRRDRLDLEVVTLLNLQDQDIKCHEPGHALFHIQEILPFHTGSVCNVSKKDFYVSGGKLFVSRTLCLTCSSFLEFDLRCQDQAAEGAVSVHWNIGPGSFSTKYLERFLSRVASQSDHGFLSRTKRNAKTNASPQFQPPIYQVSVAENRPAGTSVVTLRATDPDQGDAGRLEYFIEALFDSRSNNLFIVEHTSGLVSTVEELDRETKDTHVFRVTAVDHGSPRRTAMATLTVTVSDTNDHDPVFEQLDYKESVRENLEIGYEVLTVRATDGDAPVNGNILYNILNSNGSNDVFEIDPRSGVIRTRGPVDRETVESFMLLVEANDQGRTPRPRSATASVHIVVEDDNDNAPQFSEKRYIVQVAEDLMPNTEILQVNATDQDRGSNAVVHFSIMSGNTRGQFYIDAQSGKLDLVSQLDYETNKEYTLRIRAQDGGRPPLSNISGLVTVQVLDVNDNAPIFVSTPFQATVLENVPLGYSVIHIQAVDADSGDNSRLEYRLMETTPNFPFAINNSTGWIVVAAELDRESVDFYSFGVEARDNGTPAMSSSASISMTVLDVNDNNPEFTQKAYYMRLNEDAAVGTSAVTVSAVDRDINSVVTYQISSGNTRNRFSITSQSGGGLITLALPLDYKLERQYVLSVTASDGTRFDVAKVYINITDANTHRPVFQSSHYTININEDRPVGTTVVVISATDEDTGENARITYYMDDSIPQFTIDQDSGAVTTQVDLDYEDQVSYTLAITARDNGIPQKSDTTYLEILVNDVNDNAPRFLRDRYLGSVMEDVPVYTSVVQVSATDQDSGLNGRVFYTFQGGDDGDGDFIIESTSGIVRTLRRLDRENTAMYNLQAFAVDKGLPALKTSMDIQVTILDVNDNPPVFEKDEFDIFVEENSPIGLVVAHVTATDPDEGSNAQIMYQIVEGNIPEVFQLDIFTGELMALTDLDYETRSEYVIVVQATSAPLVSRATVHIRLIDRNDNPPVLKNFQIIFNNYVTERSSSFPTGTIGKIPAHDPDISDQLSYWFEAGNELHLLILNQTTGEIRLSQDLDNNRPLEASMRIAVSEFLEGVANVLSAHRDDVIIFNVQDDTDVNAAILNVSLSVFRLGDGLQGASLPEPDLGDLLAGCGALPEELQERLYLNRSLLAYISSQQVLPFDDNICLREPCENYMKCVSVLKFDSMAPFVASDTILFRPIQPITGLRCRCPAGFTGEFCETEIDLCYSNPCGNHGACRSHEGGFTCECREDYTGETKSTVSPFVQGGVSDGEWHSVHLHYYNRGPSDQKVVVVTVDDCDTSVALRFGRTIGNYSCAAQSSQSGSKKSLDLTGPLLLGGVPHLPEDFPVQSRQFVGCMKDLHIDSRYIDMNGYIANNGTCDRCDNPFAEVSANGCEGSTSLRGPGASIGSSPRQCRGGRATVNQSNGVRDSDSSGSE
ncbi:Cadherin EGF LAG seven-pass G-type receptor 2 [Bagarius yarrelli]|uniref:Cadherin EGF LAG seven-pass G-type receptor 2 n=1 Tax=Bagarius yarrelli TaxID=175774 RepID=A0A556VVD1_BAGYA|nr:Cadherin EGF LAG seven-pass G-type receptor 2 [Bagarius yarrelli]